ncbi:MAG: nitrogen regulation protein NR(I) [Sphingomonadaceae bacterium]|nr:nitrogen regulation protein NR(I) [Sphingomonadaceae bacterium]
MTRGKVLLVDDDAAIRVVVTEALRRDGHEVRAAASVAEEVALLESFAPDILVTDVILPDGNGLDLVPSILAKRPDLPVIVLSAQNTLTTAVRATEQGAFEYLPKPFDLDELCRAVRDGLKRSRHEDAPPSEDAGLPLIGRSPAMQNVYRMIARVVATDLTVLILGESGTGKELVARALHDLGPRRAAPFVAINMAAIPRELIEAELFGHERGAFTGATARTAGRFEQAAGGTLFLDEIGDMPMEAQTRLLRVLQSGEFTTVGGARPVSVDVRIIAATHKNLAELIADGRFREDLYYRLAVVPVELPPLRRRGGDVALLARHFLERAAAGGLPRKRLDAASVDRLAAHGWPGNVRELENLMRRLAAIARDPVIPAAMIDAQLAPVEIGGATPAETLSEAVAAHLGRLFLAHGGGLPPPGLHARMLAEVERPLLEATLAAVRGNQLRAAELLGINRNTLRKKLTELGVAPVRGK